MIQLSEATAIALHSMVYISKKEIVSLKEIAKRFDISENHLSKVLQRLVKENYLISLKGPSGGFSINSKKKDIAFIKIYEAIEGKNKIRACLFTKSKRDCENCIMGNLIKKINNEFLNYMTHHKISEFSL